MLSNPKNCETIREAIKDYVTINDTPGISPSTLWEAHKPVIRGQIIQLSSRLKKMHKAKLESLERIYMGKADQFKKSPTNKHRLQLDQARLNLNSLLDREADKLRFYTTHKYYSKFNRPDTMLANKLKNINRPNIHLKLRTSKGTQTSNPNIITKIFKEFLEKLYKSKGDWNEAAFKSYMSEIQLPTLQTAQRELLESPITVEEVKLAIKNMAPNKAPGPDGFPGIYYQKFAEELIPILHPRFNGILKGHLPSPDALRTSICMIPKPDSDLTTPSNYRPISLINTDMKILAKIIVTRLNPILRNIIHNDQTGFVQTRQASDNIRRTILLTQHAIANKIPSLLLSLDIQKAFDSVSWPYLHAVLNHWGFGANFRTWICSLYNAPSAQITYAGLLSEPFAIQKGTRQGCPLSPALFALALEPLAQAIRTNSSIEGIKIGETNHKISLFADDALCYITRPLTTLPNLMRTLNRFMTISGLTLNPTKSTLMNLNLPEKERENISAHFPFNWTDQSLKYLGVKLTPLYSDLFECNYLPTAQKLYNLMDKWHEFKLSMLGRIAAVQMTLLPKILYLFRTLPIYIPPKFLNNFQARVNAFIWAKKKPRVASQTITQRKTQGGLGVPNFTTYYQAARLSQTTTYSDTKDPPLWVEIEKALIHPTGISNILWLPTRVRPPITSPITKSTVELWDQLKSKHKMTSKFPPLISFMGNPQFPAALFDPNRYLKWQELGLTTVHNLGSPKGLPPLPDLLIKHPNLNADPFAYLQIKAFYETHSNPEGNPMDMTTFEKICTQTSPKAGTISTLYKFLLSSPHPHTPKYVKKWEEDLEIILPREAWTSIWNNITSGTPYASYNETNLKVLTRWYNVPLKLHRIKSSISPLCFRECKNTGSYFHIWWTCPVVSRFWIKIFKLASTLCDITLTPDPTVALLHRKPSDINKQHFKLIKYLLSTAKLELAKSWLTSKASIQNVKQRMHWTMQMEKRSAVLQDNSERFDNIWKPWQQYTLQIHP